MKHLWNASACAKSLPNTEAIEKRVVHSTAHSKTMRTEECEVIIGPAVKRVGEILQNIQNIDWEPAESETWES